MPGKLQYLAIRTENDTCVITIKNDCNYEIVLPKLDIHYVFPKLDIYVKDSISPPIYKTSPANSMLQAGNSSLIKIRVPREIRVLKIIENNKNEIVIPISIPEGYIQFYDNYIPPFKEGETYKIVVNAKLSAGEQTSSFPEATQSFKIATSAFGLDKFDVHAVYPPANSNGLYDLHLPSLVFNKPELPWERSLDNASTNSTEDPWFALLCFDANELSHIDGPQQMSDTMTKKVNLKEWLQEPSLEHLKKPEISISELDGTEVCDVIQVKLRSFLDICPKFDEIKYFAHVQQINPENISEKNQLEAGWFSVLFSNRFPNGQSDKSTSNLVHLVSIKGLEKILTSTNPNDDIFVQAISLYSWGFTCLPELHEDYNALISRIAEETNSNDCLLKVDYAEQTSDKPQIPMFEAYLKAGYVPLIYEPRSAETTISWYRGPFTANTDINKLTESDQAYVKTPVIYDNETGMIDLSYSTAWQVGRTLALHDVDFTQNLMQLRFQLRQKMQDQVRKNECTSMSKSMNVTTSRYILNAFKQGVANYVEAVERLPQQPNTLRSSFNTINKEMSFQEKYLERSTKLVQQSNNEITIADIPQLLLDWTKKLVLLNNLPFAYLVPEESMLPNEGMRFFYVDQNWLENLINGAFSLGMHSKIDFDLNVKIVDLIKSVQTYPKCGFILKSEVISGWPNLIVAAKKQNNEELKFMLKVKLAGDVLLVLYPDIPAKIEIHQPHEQLGFGAVGSNLQNATISLRNLGNTGVNDPPKKQISDVLRDPKELRVLDVKEILKFMHYVFPGTKPHDFALQFIREPFTTSFSPKLKG